MQGKWIDVDSSQYHQCKVMSYADGSTWLRTPWHVFFVCPMAPYEISQFFMHNPLGTVRMESLTSSASEAAHS